MVWHFEALLDINLAVNLQEDFGSQIIHTLLPSGRRGEETHAPRKCQESGWASGFAVIGALFSHQIYSRGLSQIDRICMCSLRHETSLDYRVLLLWPWHYLNAIRPEGKNLLKRCTDLGRFEYVSVTCVLCPMSILAISFRLISSCAYTMYCTNDNVSCCQ